MSSFGSILIFLVACLASQGESFQDTNFIQGGFRPRHGIVNKMNVSQDEFNNKLNVYFRRIKSSGEDRRHFTLNPTVQTKSERTHRFTFQSDWSKVEGVIFKFLAVGERGPVDLEIYRVVGDKQEFITMRHLQGGSPIWVDVPLPEPEKSEPIVTEVLCSRACRIDQPLLNVITKTSRVKRAPDLDECSYRRVSPTDHRCCRKPFEVIFRLLPAYSWIVQPFKYDAGYCEGTCPFGYHEANRHSSLRAYVFSDTNISDYPDLCCAPSKLKNLEILYLDEDDLTALKVANFKKMRVIECSCW